MSLHRWPRDITSKIFWWKKTVQVYNYVFPKPTESLHFLLCFYSDRSPKYFFLKWPAYRELFKNEFRLYITRTHMNIHHYAIDVLLFKKNNQSTCFTLIHLPDLLHLCIKHWKISKHVTIQIPCHSTINPKDNRLHLYHIKHIKHDVW